MTKGRKAGSQTFLARKPRLRYGLIRFLDNHNQHHPLNFLVSKSYLRNRKIELRDVSDTDFSNFYLCQDLGWDFSHAEWGGWGGGSGAGKKAASVAGPPLGRMGGVCLNKSPVSDNLAQP